MVVVVLLLLLLLLWRRRQRRGFRCFFGMPLLMKRKGRARSAS